MDMEKSDVFDRPLRAQEVWGILIKAFDTIENCEKKTEEIMMWRTRFLEESNITNDPKEKAKKCVNFLNTRSEVFFSFTPEEVLKKS